MLKQIDLRAGFGACILMLIVAVLAMVTVGCGSAEAIRPDAIQGSVMDVCSRHDAYVKADENLSDLERRTYLASSALLIQVVNTAKANGGGGGEEVQLSSALSTLPNASTQLEPPNLMTPQSTGPKSDETSDPPLAPNITSNPGETQNSSKAEPAYSPQVHPPNPSLTLSARPRISMNPGLSRQRLEPHTRA